MLVDHSTGRPIPAPRTPAPFQTFVISLNRAFERRAHMRRLMRRLGLAATFIDAVDGQALTLAERERYDAAAARRVYGCEMSGAEIACALSHLSVFERMLAEGIEAALVLEDDVDCEDDLAFLAGQLCALPVSDWSVVRLESLKPSVAFPKTRRATGRRIASLAGHDLSRIAIGVQGAGAYLIRRPAAEALLRQGARVFLPFDQMMERY